MVTTRHVSLYLAFERSGRRQSRRAAFMRGASEWAINEYNGNYDILPYRKDPEGSQAWVADNEHKTQFPAGTTRDHVIERMIKIIQAAAASK
jgi:hypothetical protein